MYTELITNCNRIEYELEKLLLPLREETIPPTPVNYKERCEMIKHGGYNLDYLINRILPLYESRELKETEPIKTLIHILKGKLNFLSEYKKDPFPDEIEYLFSIFRLIYEIKVKLVGVKKAAQGMIKTLFTFIMEPEKRVPYHGQRQRGEKEELSVPKILARMLIIGVITIGPLSDYNKTGRNLILSGFALGDPDYIGKKIDVTLPGSGTENGLDAMSKHIKEAYAWAQSLQKHRLRGTAWELPELRDLIGSFN